MRPTRDWPFPQEGKACKETSSLPPSTDDFVPAWPCSRRGLPGHAHYCARRWSLTPPFHSDCPHPFASLPKGEGLGVRERLVSVALIRQVHASRRFPRPGCYPTPCSTGVRTFLDPVNAEPRLPNQPGVIFIIHVDNEGVNVRKVDIWGKDIKIRTRFILMKSICYNEESP